MFGFWYASLVIVWCPFWNEYAWYTILDESRILQVLNSEGELLAWEAKVVCFLKIWWRLNEALLNYLEAINIGMKSTLMKERRFDDIHGDQGWNVCSPCTYILKKVCL